MIVKVLDPKTAESLEVDLCYRLVTFLQIFFGLSHSDQFDLNHFSLKFYHHLPIFEFLLIFFHLLLLLFYSIESLRIHLPPKIQKPISRFSPLNYL